MLFFVNEQGTTVNMVNEPVNVGSTNANEVILVAPISQANQVTIAFRLPNGATVSERIMSLLEQQLVINNKTYSVYRYLMDGTITAVSGICKVQFKIYQYQFTNDDSVRNAVLATYTSNFVIREGIFATFPETPTSTIYQQILTYLATLNPNYLVQSVDYVNENSLIEPETWISGVHNKIVCYDPTSLNAYGVTSACELSLANLFGGQNKPLFICNTEMADVYTDEDATNIGTGAKIENVSTNLHTGKIQVNISNCKYDTVIKVAHLENSSWVVDGTFVVRAANGSNVNIICGIQKTNVSAFAVFQDYNATRELDESKGDDYLPPKTAHDNDPSITEFQGFTKERYQINSVYTWAYTQDGDVWDMVGGTLQLKMLNGNIWSFPDFDYNATKLACKEYKDLAHKWANYSDDSDTPSVTNNAYYYSEMAHGWANNYQAGTPSATNNAMYFAGQSATSAVNASNSETAANNSKLAAQAAEANAHAWATGESTDGTSPSSTNNAKYFADSAETNALKSEGYAVGTQNGVAAQEGEPYYHDNAKYYHDTLMNEKFAKDLTADLNSTTYVVTLKLYSSTTHIDSGDNSTLLATQTFDLPIESAIVNIQYVDTEEHPTSLLFTLQSGATTYVPIGSIISGLATETYVDGEIDKIKDGTYAAAVLDGAIVANGNTYAVSGLVDVINSTLYWKHASHAVDASNLLVSGVAKSGATIQGEINAKIPKANIDTSIPATPLDTNVPSTKLLNDTTNGLKADLEDGDVVVAESIHSQESDVASNLVNDSGKMLDPDVASSSGTIYKDEAFVQRATAIPFSGETVTVANGVEERLKDQALSVNKNQLLQRFVGFNPYRATVSYDANYVATITNSGTSNAILYRQYFYQSNHYYFIKITCKQDESGALVFKDNSDYQIILTESVGVWVTKAFVYQYTGTVSNPQFQLSKELGAEGNKTYWKDVELVDLTQFFQSQPAMASCTAKWFLQNYPEYTSYVAYNAGTLEDTPSYKYVTTNENLWDEEIELGTLDVNDGSEVSGTSNLRSKNFIPVFPTATYYFLSPSNMRVFEYDENKSFIKVNSALSNNTLQLQPNTTFIKFFLIQGYGTTYKNDIQICNHFTEQDVENTYHPHKEWERNVDWSWTSTGKGKSTPRNKDVKDYVNRKNIEKVGQVVLSEQNWTIGNNYSWGQVYLTSISGIYHTLATTETVKRMMCNKYAIQEPNDANPNNSAYLNCVYKFTGATSNVVAICLASGLTNAQVQEAVTGAVLNYDLATPIESDMSESEINTTIESDYGNEVKVPLSSSDFMSGSFTTIFYQDNVLRQIYNNKDAIEKMPSANGLTDGDYICKVSSGIASYVTPESEGYVKPTSITGYDATKTQTLKNVSGTLTWVDDV